MDKKLIEKFKAGKCTPEEIRKILLWYQSEEAEASFSVEIEGLWSEQKDMPFSEKEATFNAIRKKVQLSETVGNRKAIRQRPQVFQRRREIRSRRISIVTAFILIALASVSLYFFDPRALQGDKVVTEVAIHTLTKETAPGQKYTLSLPDGTTVKLNSGSRLQYPEKFTDSLRVVEFEGEAFFDVKKDKDRPFIIKSGTIKTTVLGTSFNLKAAAEAESFEVAVVTGSVKVSRALQGPNLDERYVTPNQAAVFDQKRNTFSIGSFDPASVLAWTHGIIVFKNSSLADITRTLESWYGVETDTSRLKRKISRGYTGSYKDKSLETVLEGISYVLDIQYEIEGKKVFIR